MRLLWYVSRRSQPSAASPEVGMAFLISKWARMPMTSQVNGTKNGCIMKNFNKIFFAAVAAAFGLASCSQELTPVEKPQGNLVTVNFGAEASIEPATKATLTTEDELTFKSAWENGDIMSVKYSNGNEANGTVPATWNASSQAFEATLPEYTGMWDYNTVYPAPDADGKVDFGSVRTQKGNAYNSNYDLMKGAAIAENAAAGKDDNGKNIIFEMTRQTAVAYFHLTGTLDEEVVSAKLSVEGDGAYISTSDVKANEDYAKGYVFTETEGVASKEINLTFDAGTAPKASDFKLWFNVLPTKYTKMTLTVETTGHTMTISRTAADMYEAGKLYKVVKAIPAEKWVKKGGDTPSTYIWDLSVNSTSEASAEQIGWTNEVADMLCVRAQNGTAANNYYPGTSNYTSTRFYSNSTLSITPKVGKSLWHYVFLATSDKYATALKNSSWENATAIINENNKKLVYIMATDPTKAVSAKISATCGFTKVECHTEAFLTTPTIETTSTSINVSAAGGEESISYKILFPVSDAVLTATSSEIWIKSLNCETEGTVSFTVDKNEGEERTATITLSYPDAENVTVSVKQSAAGAGGADIKTATLIKTDIVGLGKLAYTTEKTLTKDGFTWSFKAFKDETRPWAQIKKDKGAYVKLSAPKPIKEVRLTITSAQNSSGGIADITKHTAYSGDIHLKTVDAVGNSDTNDVAKTSTVTNNISTLVPTGSSLELYIKVSTGARIWGIEVDY